MVVPFCPRVLAIGAHPDDIELGAGGFIHRLANERKAVVNFLILTQGLQGVTPVTMYTGTERVEEATRAAGLLGVPAERVEIQTLPDCGLHNHGHEAIRHIERVLFDRSGAPRFDLVLTHSGEDTHADHRAAHESTLSAVRNFHGTVLLYQAPSTKPNGFRPTFFPRLSRADVAQKDLAIAAHVSQRGRVYTDAVRTHGLAGNWAIFHRLPAGTYLEAFEVYKSFY